MVAWHMLLLGFLRRFCVYSKRFNLRICEVISQNYFSRKLNWSHDPNHKAISEYKQAYQYYYVNTLSLLDDTVILSQARQINLQRQLLANDEKEITHSSCVGGPTANIWTKQTVFTRQACQFFNWCAFLGSQHQSGLQSSYMLSGIVLISFSTALTLTTTLPHTAETENDSELRPLFLTYLLYSTSLINFPNYISVEGRRLDEMMLFKARDWLFHAFCFLYITFSEPVIFILFPCVININASTRIASVSLPFVYVALSRTNLQSNRRKMRNSLFSLINFVFTRHRSDRSVHLRFWNCQRESQSYQGQYASIICAVKILVRFWKTPKTKFARVPTRLLSISSTD